MDEDVRSVIWILKATVREVSWEIQIWKEHEDEVVNEVLDTLTTLIDYFELIDGKCRCGQPRMWPSGGHLYKPQFTLIDANDVNTFPKITPFEIYHLPTYMNKPFIYYPIKGHCEICRLPIKRCCYICD